MAINKLLLKYMMNASSLRLNRKNIFLLVAILSCWGVILCQKSFASPDDASDDAALVARAWISQIDAGQFDASYKVGCREFQDKVSNDKWTLVLKTLRTPLGAVVSRTEVSRQYKENGIPGLDGECMIITYDTSFEKMMDAKEVVVLKKEDGRWLGAGYNAGPKPNPEADQAPQQPPQTQVDTQTVQPDISTH